MFAKVVSQFPPCSSYVDLCAQCIGYVVDGIKEDGCEQLLLLMCSVWPEILSMFWIKGQVLHCEHMHLNDIMYRQSCHIAS